MLSLSRKDRPAKKIFQEQYTIQRGNVSLFYSLVAFSAERKGLHSLRLQSRSYRLNAKSRVEGKRGGGEGRFRQTPRDTPSNQEPISGGNYCVLGHLNANLVTLHSLVYNASKRGWDPFIGILLPGSWKGSHPSRRALSLSRVRVTFYPRLKMHRAFRNEFPDTCAE